jgi:hypothetical protein
MGVCLRFFSRRQQLSAPWAICFQSTAVWYNMVCCTLEQYVFLYDTYVKYTSAGKCWRKFRRKFHDERVPSRQTIHNMVNKLTTMRFIIDKKRKHKRWVFTEKLDDIAARLEHTARKSLKCLAQETGVSKSSAKWQHNCWSHPMKVGVLCAVSRRRTVVRVF